MRIGLALLAAICALTYTVDSAPKHFLIETKGKTRCNIEWRDIIIFFFVQNEHYAADQVYFYSKKSSILAQINRVIQYFMLISKIGTQLLIKCLFRSSIPIFLKVSRKCSCPTSISVQFQQITGSLKHFCFVNLHKPFLNARELIGKQIRNQCSKLTDTNFCDATFRHIELPAGIASQRIFSNSVRCCLGGRIDSIPCRASYFAPGRFEEYVG